MIAVRHLSLRDFRSYGELELDLAPGLTVVTGDNGNGKTNLIESIGFLARLASFRGAPTDAVIGLGADRLVVRGDVLHGEREVLIEVEAPRDGRMRTLVNKQRLVRRGDLAEVLTTTVFAPDDLEIVKGGPGGRRDFVDELLVDLHPKNDAACSDFAKVLKQRNALLKQLGGRRSLEADVTLDVWDSRLADLGERLASLRRKVLAQLTPYAVDAYRTVAGVADLPIALDYRSAWQDVGLAAALAGGRDDDVRRGVSTVGPHRDDVEVAIGGMPVRTHASQGEQRSVMLALRLAAHQLVTTARGEAPVLLLDDVFSELDPRRSAALLDSLPPGQKLLTTASGLPPGAVADAVLHVADSTITVG